MYDNNARKIIEYLIGIYFEADELPGEVSEAMVSLNDSKAALQHHDPDALNHIRSIEDVIAGDILREINKSDKTKPAKLLKKIMLQSIEDLKETYDSEY